MEGPEVNSHCGTQEVGCHFSPAVFPIKHCPPPEAWCPQSSYRQQTVPWGPKKLLGECFSVEEWCRGKCQPISICWGHHPHQTLPDALKKKTHKTPVLWLKMYHSNWTWWHNASSLLCLLNQGSMQGHLDTLPWLGKNVLATGVYLPGSRCFRPFPQLGERAGAPGHAAVAWMNLYRPLQACVPAGHARKSPQRQGFSTSPWLQLKPGRCSPWGWELLASILRGTNFCTTKNFAPGATVPMAPYATPLLSVVLLWSHNGWHTLWEGAVVHGRNMLSIQKSYFELWTLPTKRIPWLKAAVDKSRQYRTGWTNKTWYKEVCFYILKGEGAGRVHWSKYKNRIS